MKDSSGIPQLVLRIALGLGFILPIMDRFGFLGAPGAEKVAWGDWAHFVKYTNVLMPYLNNGLANIAAGFATAAEAVLGICLLIGFQTKYAAFGTALITLFFALAMIFSLGIGAPFNYPVFVFTGAGLVLSCQNSFKWSVDYYRSKQSNTIN